MQTEPEPPSPGGQEVGDCARSPSLFLTVARVLPPAAAPAWRQEPLRGPRGGSDGQERLAGVGDGVQRRLGNHGGHGGLSAAGPGLCQQLFPGELKHISAGKLLQMFLLWEYEIFHFAYFVSACCVSPHWLILV